MPTSNRPNLPCRCPAAVAAAALLAALLPTWHVPAHAQEDPAPAPVVTPRTDAQGDPLPPGALMRLGTVRLRAGGHVRCLAFSPNGKTLASAGFDHVVRLWEVATGRPLARLEGHQGLPNTNPVLAVTFSPDGKLLASASYDQARLWDVTTGKERFALHGHHSTVEAVAFSPDGKTLVTGGWDHTLLAWDVATGKVLHKMIGHRGPVTAAVFSRDGRILLSAGTDGTVRLWEAATGKILTQLDAGGKIACLALAPDGKTFASAGADKTIRVWALKGQPKEIRTITYAAPMPLQTLVYTPDGGKLVGVGIRGPVRAWDVNSGTELPPLLESPGLGAAVAFSPDGKRLATGGEELRLLDAVTGARLLPGAGHDSAIDSVAVSPDGRLAATAAADKVIRLWNPATGKEVRQLRPRNPDRFGYGYRALVFTADGKRLISGTYAGIITLWDPATGAEGQRFEGLPGSLGALDLSAAGRFLAGGGERGIRVWTTADARLYRRLDGPGRPTRALAFSPDGHLLATVGLDGATRLLDVDKGGLLHQLAEGEQLFPRALAFSPDGRRVAVLGNDVRLFDPPSGEMVKRLGVDGRRIFLIRYAPDGKSLVGGGWDGTVYFWDASTGEERARLRGHQGPVRCLAFSADAKVLLSGSADTTALVWDVRQLVKGPRPSVAASGPRPAGDPWADLGGEDAAHALLAMRALARTPRESVALLRLKLLLAAPDRVGRLVRELASDRPQVRERATDELERLGDEAAPGLHKALADKPAPALRRQIEGLLAKQLVLRPGDARLQRLRAVELLEMIATPEARQVLELLRRQAPEAEIRSEAEGALKRLSKAPGSSGKG